MGRAAEQANTALPKGGGRHLHPLKLAKKDLITLAKCLPDGTGLLPSPQRQPSSSEQTMCSNSRSVTPRSRDPEPSFKGAACLAPGGAAAGCHRRLALRARPRWHVRPGAFGSPVAASRCALGAEGAGAAVRTRAPTCPPPLICACWMLPLGGGDMSKTSCRCALLETLGATRASSPAEGEGGEGRSRHHDAQACWERLCVCCGAAACAVRVGATRHWERERLPPPGQADPLHFERARAAARAVEAS